MIGSTTRKRAVRAGASASAAAIALLTAAPAQAAGVDPGVDVVNTETVQVYLSPTGHVDTQRVYEQLQLTGKGKVDLENPISTDHLRNLDGFTGFDVRDGKQVVHADVDGTDALRSVSDFDGKLPLDVSVQYKLDGKTVQPGDVVGADGKLEVLYTVENVTGSPQELTYDDGHGGTVTKTVDVPIPMVASLTTTAPADFDNVTSTAANMAGDGHGGTLLSFTMTLFPPIASTKATVGYTADIHDGVVPRAEIQALPVDPLASPTFASAADSYQGGADSGIELTDGATQIDTNLLKLRDGASDLLAGLIQLDDGAAQLRDGLSGEAAPGAAKLADGAGQLDDGLGRLAAGAGDLSDGTGAALSGSRQLQDGLGRISGGLDQLADAQKGLPAAQDGIKQLRDGVDQLLVGVGDVDKPDTLLGGLAALEAGLQDGLADAPKLRYAIASILGSADGSSGLYKARGGVDQVKAGLDSALADGGDLAQLLAGLQALDSQFCTTHPAAGQCSALVGRLEAGVGESRTKLQGASGGLGQVSTGLGTAIITLDKLVLPGADQLLAGLGDAADGVAKLKAGGLKVRGGLLQVSDGMSQLAAGVTAAVQGVAKLADGAGQAHTGSMDLTDGLGKIDDGAGQLASGAGEAKDGSAQVADGAGRLSDGLQTAADGSDRLADGLDQAADGAPQLVDGAQRLSDEGTKKLVDAGESTAQDYGQMVAVMSAGAQRADSQAMAFGAPEGASGLTAYSYVLQGDDGEGGRNLTRGIAGGLILAAGAGVFALRRRLV